MTRLWEAGDVVRLFEGAYGTGTIFRLHGDGLCDVARPYCHATDTGSWNVGVEVVTYLRLSALSPAEVSPAGDPRNYKTGVYTHDDLKKVASGEWKI